MRVGLLIQDLVTEYSNTVVKGVKKYCTENNIQLFVFTISIKNWNYGGYEYQHIACKEFATKNNVDGIILVTSTYLQNTPKEQHFKVINEFNYIPMVSFGMKVPGFSSVTESIEENFQNLLNHLRQNHECENIFFMGPKNSSQDINLRLQIFENFIKSNNQSVEDKIIEANFTYEAAMEALENLNISKDNLPFDAIVCCNDDLAFGCIDYLKKKGIDIGEEVKITGFDNQMRCDYIKPSLTSIDLMVAEQGYEAAKLIQKEILNPDAEKKDIVIKSKTVYRHSCGCKIENKNDELLYGNYFKLRQNVYQYQYFIQALQATVQPENIKAVLIESLKGFGIGSCICCLYDHSVRVEKNERFKIPEKAHIYFAYNREKDYVYDSDYVFNPQNKIYPENFVFNEGKEVVVTALFDHEYQFGYIAYTPGELDFNAYELIVKVTTISLATNIVFFEKLHETEKLALEKLALETETYFDQMTGAMNRRGLYKYAIPAMESALERGLTGGVIFSDMDYLKVINDRYGHEAGDKAIKGMVEILKKSLRPQDVIARIGGDEFVIVACGLKSESYGKVKKRIQEETAKYNESHNEPFEISISLGYVEFTNHNKNLDSLIKEADEIQYKEKVMHHKNRT